MPRSRTSGWCSEFAAVTGRPMAQVNVTINGRQFRMACEDGQEDHLQQLAQGPRRAHRRAARPVRRDRRHAAHRHGGADGGRRAGGSRQEAQAAGGGPCRPAGRPRRRADRAQATQAAIVAAFNAAAERIEDITKKLSQTGGRRKRRRTGPGFTVAHVPFRSAWLAVAAASALHCAGRGCGVRQSHIPRGLTILKGAVPGRARGSGHMAPTYFCRFPGSRSDGHRGSALSCFPSGAMDFESTVDDDDHFRSTSAKPICARPRSRGAMRCQRPSGRPRPRRSRRGRSRFAIAAGRRSCPASRR